MTNGGERQREEPTCRGTRVEDVFRRILHCSGATGLPQVLQDVAVIHIVMSRCTFFFFLFSCRALACPLTLIIDKGILFPYAHGFGCGLVGSWECFSMYFR